MNHSIIYILFREYRTDELMVEAAMSACRVEKPMTGQYGLVSYDAVIVNGVQDPGFTPFEEFLPRSAPALALSVSRVCQVPDITSRSLSALKAQIRVEQGRAESTGQRLLRRKRILKGLNVKNCNCPLKLKI